MDPSRLRELLAVLRDAGVLRIRMPIEIGGIRDDMAVEFAAQPSDARGSADKPSAGEAPDEQLPDLAFDPIARRKAAKAQT